jgi:hypothetical protein
MDLFGCRVEQYYHNMKQQYEVIYLLLQNTERFKLYLPSRSEYEQLLHPTKIADLFPVGEARTDIKSLLLCTESKSST